MNRLDKIFADHRKALIIFDSCGFPDMAESEARLETIISSGADILELGIPFSDPVADGPVIQQASQQALANGVTLEKILDMAERLRRRHPETGLVFFGYYNVFLQYGLEKLFRRLQRLEADGILIVDLPYEEREEILPYTQKYQVPQITLIGPSTDRDRAEMLLKAARGFAYCVNARGVTGARSCLPRELAGRLDTLREISPIPVAAGFGVADAASAAALIPHADAVVVGSAVVRRPLAELGEFVADLKRAVTAG